MSYILIIIIILAALGALLVAHRVSQKEKLNRKIRSQAKRLLHRANEIWDVAENTSNYINAPDITEALMDYYIHQIRKRDEMLSNTDTDSLIQTAEAYKANQKNAEVKNELKNDQEINQAKRAFSKTSKTLKTALAKKLITGQGCIAMRNALRRRILDLEVDTYERMGDSAGERSDPALATNYYKYAKKILIESDLKFEGKNERVRDITQKTQTLFGNIIEDKLSQGLGNEEDTVDEHGIPRDLDVMAGNKKKF